jgi:hypothetical protein
MKRKEKIRGRKEKRLEGRRKERKKRSGKMGK